MKDLPNKILPVFKLLSLPLSKPISGFRNLGKQVTNCSRLLPYVPPSHPTKGVETSLPAPPFQNKKDVMKVSVLFLLAFRMPSVWLKGFGKALDAKQS